MHQGRSAIPDEQPTACQRAFFHLQIEKLWSLIVLVCLVAGPLVFGPRSVCETLGTDFRGYYASAQIALQHGFSSVYDQELQNAYQAALPLRCLDSSLIQPRLKVSMPYLPVFVILFLPFSLFGFTNSYLIFSALNLVILAVYLLRFSKAFRITPSFFELFAWSACLPAISNLGLGQSNVFLMICLGEFSLAFLNEKPRRSGLWLAGMLIKPLSLIMLLPGLILQKRWRVLIGFLAGGLMIMLSSLLLAGTDGVHASLELARRFGGPLIQTGPAMMNWRALALNLETFFPEWVSWGIAVLGMLIMSLGTLKLWCQKSQQNETAFLLLMLASLTATFTISWHSHFYMLVLLIPILLVLNHQKQLPPLLLAAWFFGPVGLLLLFFFIQPILAANILGLGYLGLNVILFTWAIRQFGIESKKTADLERL